MEEQIENRVETIPDRDEMIEVITHYCEGLCVCDWCRIRDKCDYDGDAGYLDYWSNDQLYECYERLVEEI